MDLHRRFGRLERLEGRRHLSASYLVGCSCSACTGQAPESPVSTSAEQDGSEARLMALRLAPAPAPATPAMGPVPPAQTSGVTAQGVVGGTASVGRQPEGALTGKVVFTVGGHGFTAFTSGWHTQRPEVTGTEMVEDLGNQDQMTFYVNHLWNAGATVVALRPVGYQPNEVILDNDSAGVTYTGTWNNSTSTIFYGSPGDVPYRFAAVSATETATARYTPNIPAAGFYPVYTWVKDDVDRIDQLYRVSHSGGITEVRVNHARVGKGYVYLGTYHFNAGTGGYVEISNQGTNTGSSVVIADHIRFGNGMGDIDRGLGTSGQTRSDESALYWIEHQRGQGVADTVFRGPGSPDSDDSDNVSAPPRWAAHMNREQAGTNNEIFLSFHSNAGNGSSRGTVGLYNGNNTPSTKTPFQFEWASLVGKETNDDMVALGNAGKIEHTWFHRSNPTLDRSDIEFGEINNSVINNEFDATILEVAFHDNIPDSELMRDPKVRDWVARASLQATIKYFNQYGGSANSTLPPDAPTNARAVSQPNGDVVISWAPAPVDAIGGGAASGYIVYRSSNGYGFDTGTAVAGTSLTIPAAQVAAGANYFRVSATNAGGESMPSETIAARTDAGPGAKVLIVNGFDRIDRFLNPTQTTPISYDPPFNPGTGNTFERVRPRFSNAYDYVSQAAEAIEAFSSAPLRFDTASNEAVIAGQVNLSGYAAVVWLAGEEGVADDTFNATEQTLVSNYLNAGGKLFVSGSEIGFDLDAGGNGASFYNNQLRADYVADSGGSYTASGAAGSLFAGISLTFDNGAGGTYNVNSPDRIAATSGSTVAMNYTGAGSGAAATQYANPNGGRVVYLAFPFETITTAANRNAVMHAVLNYFSLGIPLGSISGSVFRDLDGDSIYDASEIGLDGWTVFLDADADTVLDPGESSTITSSAGEYHFDALPAGTYRVRVVQQSAWQRISPAGNGGAHVVNLAAGSNLTDLHFAQFRTAYIGFSGADAYTLRMDPANNGRVQITEQLAGQAPLTWSIEKSLLTALSFQPGSGDDTLTIEHDLASPIPAGGVTYIADAASPLVGDRLIVTGTASADTVAVAPASITFGGTVNYTGVERVICDLLGGDDVLTVHAAATVTFDATQRMHSLTLDGGNLKLAPGGDKLLRTSTLAISGGGRLDLADNDLVIDYTGDASPLNSVMSWLLSGRNGGDWLGATGIISTAAGDSGLTGLAVAEAADALALGNGDTALFAGQAVDATTLLVKYTYIGDANLDGAITGDDYSGIDFNIALPGADGYFNGDFNYDGLISGDDYSVIDFNIVAQGAAL